MSQTPEELDQLIETLTGIRAGKPWQVATPSCPDDWFDSAIPGDPKEALNQGFRIRLKPWTLPPPPAGREWHRGAEFTETDLPDGYRPLMVGECVLENDEILVNGKSWGAWRSLHRLIAPSDTLFRVRTKRPLPEPVLDPVPLGPGDVPPGSVLRNRVINRNVEWVNIRRVASDELYAAGVPLSYRALFNDGWEILRPGEDWKPCHKEPS